MKNLIMLIGPPGCGKTTFRDIFLKKSAILSTDDFLERKAAELQSTYNGVFDRYFKEAEKNLKVNLEWLIEHFDDTVVWDQTNLTRKSRKKKLDLVDQYCKTFDVFRYTKTAIFFTPSLADCIRVNKDREKNGRNLPHKVLVEMFDSFEPPTIDEGFRYCWQVNHD